MTYTCAAVILVWSRWPLLAMASISLVGCAGSAFDPESVGQGRYLQFLQGTRVVVEVDTSNAGMMDCSHQAYLSMQQAPTLKGRAKCSFQPTSDPLPFSYRAHRQLNESDGFRPSSPYLTRTLTSQVCVTMRRATSALEKTVILEDHCDAPVATKAESVAGPASTSSSTLAPATKPLAAPTGSNSLADRLRQLDQLRRENLITKDEYDKKRKAIVEQL